MERLWDIAKLHVTYTVSHKKRVMHSIFVHNFESYWPILKNSFTVGLSSKFATRLMSCFPPRLKCVTTLPCEIQKFTNSNTFDVLIIDVFLNISICVHLNHIKCSKCLPLARTHAQRGLRHSSIASLMTPCPKSCQIFVRRCFSSSTSWTRWVSQVFPCMPPCQWKIF